MTNQMKILDERWRTMVDIVETVIFKLSIFRLKCNKNVNRADILCGKNAAIHFQSNGIVDEH